MTEHAPPNSLDCEAESQVAPIRNRRALRLNIFVSAGIVVWRVWRLSPRQRDVKSDLRARLNCAGELIPILSYSPLGISLGITRLLGVFLATQDGEQPRYKFFQIFLVTPIGSDRFFKLPY